MSNVIASSGTRYFQLPDSFVRSGNLRDLSGSAVKYYVFLCQQLNQTGQVELEYTNQEICDFTGIKDHKTAKSAREELRASRRMEFRKGPSGGYIHVVLSDSGEAFTPAKGRRPVRYRVRRETAKPAPRGNPTVSASDVAPPESQIQQSPSASPPSVPEPEPAPQPAIRLQSESPQRQTPPPTASPTKRSPLKWPCRFNGNSMCYWRGVENFKDVCRRCEHHSRKAAAQRQPAQPMRVSPLTAKEMGF
jgi:hypothetical protein